MFLIAEQHYKDKSKLLRSYTAYVLTGNTFYIYKYLLDDYGHSLMEDSLTIGDIWEIIDKSPEAAGLREKVGYGIICAKEDTA